MKLNKNVIRAVLRGARPAFGSRHMGVGGRRLMLELLTAAARPPKGTRFQRVTIAGVPVDRVHPPQPATHGTLIYLHGGAYALGSAKGYRGMVAQLAAAAGMTALVPDYSRAPEAQLSNCPRGTGRRLLPPARGWARRENYCHCW